MEQTRLTEYESGQYGDDDWTFEAADTNYMTHGLHPYPARMIPQIAHRLILRYSKPGQTLWDPFCGSGTSLVESVLLGRRSIGTDLNPFAVFLSRVKTTPLDTRALRAVSHEIMRELSAGEPPPEMDPPPIQNMDYWFKPEVQHELLKLRGVIDRVDDSDIRAFFLLCMALTVREVSNVKKREFKIVRMSEDRLSSFRPSVQRAFAEHTNRCISLMDQFTRYLQDREYYVPRIIEADNRHVPLEDSSVDIVVTSPPYGDSGTTVAYGQYSKFPALWIGLDPDTVMSVDREGLGGRNHRGEMGDLGSELLSQTLGIIASKNMRRAQHVHSFFADLKESLQSIQRRLRSEGRACIVIGNRMVSRVRIPTDAIVAELGRTVGLEHEVTIERRIPTKRMPWQNAPENVEGLKADTMHRESIVILVKP
ncbi:MAG: DNA methyltransferase [Candidatus Thorarchaeota archaeon]